MMFTFVCLFTELDTMKKCFRFCFCCVVYFMTLQIENENGTVAVMSGRTRRKNIIMNTMEIMFVFSTSRRTSLTHTRHSSSSVHFYSLTSLAPPSVGILMTD